MFFIGVGSFQRYPSRSYWIYWTGLTDKAVENTWQTIFGKTAEYLLSTGLPWNSEADDCATMNAGSDSLRGYGCSLVDRVVRVLCQGELICI